MARVGVDATRLRTGVGGAVLRLPCCRKACRKRGVAFARKHTIRSARAAPDSKSGESGRESGRVWIRETAPNSIPGFVAP